MYDVRICPNCKGTNTKVNTSGRDKFLMTRVRECKDCGHKFNTVELFEEMAMELKPRKGGKKYYE